VVISLLFLPVLMLVYFASEIFTLLGMDHDASDKACEYLPIFAFAFYIEMLVEINRRFL
jgi:Na+-driven multidrug efflux pump